MLDGSPKPVGAVRSRYTHAQKMRASMTHIFGWDLGQGNQCWTKDERTDRMKGNPSVSPQLASYMVSLRNRKVRIPVAALFCLIPTVHFSQVRAGDVATSARAITPVSAFFF